jgi:hypothetical protein
MKVSNIDGDWLLHYLEIYVLIFSATISILESWLYKEKVDGISSFGGLGHQEWVVAFSTRPLFFIR